MKSLNIYHLFLFILIIYIIRYKKKELFIKKKYLVLIFSDRNGKPSKEFKPTGYGGFCHNERGYLQPLTKIAKLLNRMSVFPPPQISLNQTRHNFNRLINKRHTWNTYLNTDKIKNLETNPPFSFGDNGDIITDLSIKYYPSNISLNNIDNSVNIIALVNYNNDVTGLKRWSHLSINKELNIFDKIKLKQFSSKKYLTSNLLINCANKIISELKLEDFAFIHIRRGDFLDNRISAPPNGTRPYTSPKFVSNFIRQNVKNKIIIIATNEHDLDYKKKIVELLDGYTIIVESDILKHLSDNISKDNYCVYIILHEIAKKAKTNIGTTGYVRLGNTYHYRLSEHQN